MRSLVVHLFLNQGLTEVFALSARALLVESMKTWTLLTHDKEQKCTKSWFSRQCVAP